MTFQISFFSRIGARVTNERMARNANWPLDLKRNFLGYLVTVLEFESTSSEYIENKYCAVYYFFFSIVLQRPCHKFLVAENRADIFLTNNTIEKFFFFFFALLFIFALLQTSNNPKRLSIIFFLN